MASGLSRYIYSSVAVGSTVSGSIGNLGDYDLYEVTLVAGRSYQIDLRGRSSLAGTLIDPLLALRDQGRVLLKANDNALGSQDSRITYAATTTGTFIIQATSAQATGGSYQLSVRDVTPLTLVSSSDDATGVATMATISLTFSEAIAGGSGNIVIRRADGSVFRTISIDDPDQVAISGTKLTITPTAPLAEKTAYYVTMTPGIVVSAVGGNAFGGIASPVGLNFTTGDFTAPTLAQASPADGVTGVAASANIVLTFSEAVKAGDGSFRIYDAANDALVWQSTAKTVGQVTFAGSTVTLNPPADLIGGHSYYVQVDGNAVTDLSGLAYAGIADTTTLNFTVRDTAAPTLVSSSPADNAVLVAVDANIVLNFSETVAAGSGRIQIRRSSDNAIERTIDVSDATQVTFSGSQVIIDPTDPLAEGTGYYLSMAAGVIRDVSGNNYAGLTTATQLNFVTNDTHGPQFVSATPADESLRVAKGANIVVRFSEAVKAGSGNITIHNSDGSVFRTIAAKDARQVSFAGSLVTINPAVDLVPGASYYVAIDPGAVVDGFGNLCDGISDPFVGAADSLTVDFKTSKLNFTVLDGVAPLLASATGVTAASATTPLNKATGVRVGSDIVLNFNEPVIAGTGNIQIRRASDNAVVQTIAVGDTSQVTFAGNKVTINPAADLADGTKYYVVMASGVITDRTGTAYAGLTLPTQLGFQTEDIHAPQIVATSPSDNAIAVAADANLVLTFNEAVKAGSGTIKIWLTSNPGAPAFTIAATDTRYVTIAGNRVTINPASDLSTSVNDYYVTIDAGAFKDLFDNPFAGIADATTFNFTTRDGVAPTLTSSTPADNATGVKPSDSIVLTFSEAVQAGSGYILIRNANLTTARQISVSDISQVTFAGNTVTIRPSVPLAEQTAYCVTMASGVIKDLAGNAYAGINSATTLNFTMGDFTAPTLVSATPKDEAVNVAVGSNIYLTFNEAIKAGQGTIDIHSADGTLFWSGDVNSSAVSFAGTTVTINPPTNLAIETDYYVTLGSGVFTDLSGNPFAGITSNTTLNFRTTDTTAPVLVSSSPGNGDTEVAPGANIVLNFSENVVADSFFGPLKIVRLVDGAVITSINPTDITEVTISGSTVTINPKIDLPGGATYYIDAPMCFKDTSGNHMSINGTNSPQFSVAGAAPGDDFAATIGTTGTVTVGGTVQGKVEIAGDVDWFKVTLGANSRYDITEASIGRTGGVNDASIVGIYNSFGQKVTQGVTIVDDYNGAKDSKATFDTSLLGAGDYYIAASGHGTQTGIYQVGVALSGQTPSDTSAPQLQTMTPADNDTSVDTHANITLQFNEVVQAGAGNIVITALSGGDTRTISVTDTTQVSFSNNTMTINPVLALAAGTQYSVSVDSGAVKDLAGNNFGGIGGGSALDFQTAASASTGDAWTIMVYIAGDNNLEGFGVSDINEMEMANLPENVNVVFLYDRTPGYDATNGDWTDTEVGAVVHDLDPSTISTPTTSWGELDTGSGTTLTRFINWGTTNYAASHYGLVVWDHGGGLDGVAWDDTSNDNLSLSELSSAIVGSNARHLDFVGFDACLQAMTEQVFDLRNATDMVIASQELIPGDGWAYDRWLGSLGANPNMNTTQLASAIVDSYGQEYAGVPDITLSATDTTKLGNLDASLDAFVSAALALPTGSADWTTMRTEAAASHFYPYNDSTYHYRDLGDFMQLVATHAADTALCTAASNVVTAVDAAVVAQTGSVAGASGLSIYLPYGSQSVRSDYTPANFSFLSQVSWNSFLARL